MGSHLAGAVSIEALAKAEQDKENLRSERQSLLSTNEELRRERASLQERLDVFFQAMELDKNKASAAEVSDCNSASGIGQQIEKLHSQLVLESVTLRNEVSKLKKKKWVLKSVLASGGENEQRAIDSEIAQLRASQRERRASTSGATT